MSLIVYVEDNEINGDLVMSQMRRMDVPVIVAENGKSGIDAIIRHEPDLILMDFNLPDMNGVEVMTRVKSRSHLRNIPVIMLTADSTERTRRHAIEMGCAGYLVKPVRRDELRYVL
ncbi:MAG: response regulator, partial [Chloroflexota bacterium]